MMILLQFIENYVGKCAYIYTHILSLKKDYILYVYEHVCTILVVYNLLYIITTKSVSKSNLNYWFSPLSHFSAPSHSISMTGLSLQSLLPPVMIRKNKITSLLMITEYII